MEKDFIDEFILSKDTRAYLHSIIHHEFMDLEKDKVTNGDTVYIHGDMAICGTQEEVIAFVFMLKGNRIIVRGIHDDIRDLRYKQLYGEICDYKEIRDIFNGETVKLILYYYPILMWKNQYYGSILLYRHVYNSVENIISRNVYGK